MPEICRFYGIVIKLYFADHEPPRAMGLVAEWSLLHQRELLEQWDRVMRHESPARIDPLP